MVPNNNNTDIKKTMSPQKKDWLSRMRPVALEVINEEDKLLEKHKNLPPWVLANPYSKNNFKYHTAIKAFYICVCNADIVGCRWWFGKFKDRSLKHLEFIEECNKPMTALSMKSGKIVEEIKGQDNVYVDAATKIKKLFLAMEKILTCLEKD